MKTILATLIVSVVCIAQTAVGPRVPASGTYANRPSSPAAGTVYIVTDASVAGDCSGATGTAVSQCRYSGTVWQALGGGGGTPGGSSGQVQVNSSGSFGGQASIFATPGTQRAMECVNKTVAYNDSALTTGAPSSVEIAFLTTASNNVRWSFVTVEPTAFTGGTATLPVASIGRTGSNNSEITGALVPIGSGSTPWYSRPIPPIRNATYDLKIALSVATGTLATFTAGSLYVEACGYVSQ